MKKQSFNYTEEGTNVRWIMSVDGQEVQVFCDGELRKYTIPEKIEKISQCKEYITFDVEGGNFYQFKFEQGKFLVGDIYKKDEHIDNFASYVFGE